MIHCESGMLGKVQYEIMMQSQMLVTLYSQPPRKFQHQGLCNLQKRQQKQRLTFQQSQLPDWFRFFQHGIETLDVTLVTPVRCHLPEIVNIKHQSMFLSLHHSV